MQFTLMNATCTFLRKFVVREEVQPNLQYRTSGQQLQS